MNLLLKKSILAALVAGLVFAAFPVTSAFAQNENPPAASNEKLEQIWARQLKVYERLGKAFDNTDGRIARAQELIDNAAAKGKDVTALQAALDAFEAAVKNARPTYEGLKGIVNSHQGFDANGKVTDVEKARSTVEQMRSNLQEVKTQMDGTFKALMEALKAFREANKPAGELPQRDS